MDRIIDCAASLAESDGQPNDGNKYAWEGTAAHTLASDCLSQQLPAIAFLGRVIEVVEEGKEVAEFEADEEMTGNVQIYCDYVNDLVAANGSELYIEQRVDFSDVVEQSDSAGTSDAIMLHPISDMPGTHELHVVDLKYGKGVRVDADDNSQMMTYALGALERFQFTHDITNIRMTIVQPRLNHISEAELAVSSLRNWAEYTLKPGTKRALRVLTMKRAGLKLPAEFYNPTPENCKFCKGKARCEAIRNVVKEAVGVAEFDDLDAKEPIDVSLDDDFLDGLFPKIDLIYDWLGAIRAKIEARLFAGAQFVNAKLVRGRKGNRKWLDEAIAEADMKSMRLKTEDMYKMTLITPPAAEKLLKDNPKRLKKLLANVTQAEGRIGVAPSSDPTPAYQPEPIAFDDLDAEGAEDLA